MNDLDIIISELSANMRCALEHMEYDLAYSINAKINELIEYKTGIKSSTNKPA